MALIPWMDRRGLCGLINCSSSLYRARAATPIVTPVSLSELQRTVYEYKLGLSR